MFTIIRKLRRGNHTTSEYLTNGAENWTLNRLDAARFPTRQEAERNRISSDMHIKHVGLDGHSEQYKGQIVQIFKKKRAWRVRIISQDTSAKPLYYYGRKPHHRPERAMSYGKTLIRCGYKTVDDEEQ